MNIEEKTTAATLNIPAAGRVDATKGPKIDAGLKTALRWSTERNMDFQKLEDLSSAGMRVLLSAQKVMNHQGEMTISHVNEMIMEVFEVTGFIDILTII